jgi:hypothetical protein
LCVAGGEVKQCDLWGKALIPQREKDSATLFAGSYSGELKRGLQTNTCP